AAVVKSAQSPHVAELVERGADPRLVIEIGVIVEAVLLRPTVVRVGAAAGLLVVKDLLGGKAVRRGHGVPLREPISDYPPGGAAGRGLLAGRRPDSPLLPPDGEAIRPRANSPRPSRAGHRPAARRCRPS